MNGLPNVSRELLNNSTIEIQSGTNLTLQVFTETINPNLSVTIQNISPWYESAIVGVIVGSIITFIFTYLLRKRKEKKELKDLEYKLLSNIHALLIIDDVEERKKRLNSFVNEIYTDPRVPKIKSGKLILKTMDNVLNNKDISKEKDEIKKKLEMLRKR